MGILKLFFGNPITEDGIGSSSFVRRQLHSIYSITLLLHRKCQWSFYVKKKKETLQN